MESVPALIAGAGDHAAWRFIEFFTANIRNPNTRAAYGRAVGDFFRWCTARRVRELGHITPTLVAAYIEQLGTVRAKRTVKQHLAAVWMLFDWLVTGQVVNQRRKLTPYRRPILTPPDPRALVLEFAPSEPA